MERDDPLNFRRNREFQLSQEQIARDRQRNLTETRERIQREEEELRRRLAALEEENNEILEDIRLTQRQQGGEIRADNPAGIRRLINDVEEHRMKIFLQTVGDRYGSIGEEELNDIIAFINNGINALGDRQRLRVKYLDILEFFAIINEGLEIRNLSQREDGQLLQMSDIKWSNEVSNWVMNFSPLNNEQKRLLVQKSKLLFRLNKAMINFIISYVVRLGPDFDPEGQRRWKRTVEYYLGGGLFTPVSVVLDRELSITPERLTLYWTAVCTIVAAMNRVISSKLNLTDCVLAQNRYRFVSRYKDTDQNFGFENAIQAFPFIMCKAREGDFNPEDELIYKDLHSKFIYLVNKYPLDPEDPTEAKYIWIKIKVKRIYTQRNNEGEEEKETKYIVFTLHPIADYVDSRPLTNGSDALIALTGTYDTFRRFMRESLYAKLEKNAEKYNDYELLTERNSIDLESIFIVYTQISRRVKLEEGTEFNENAEVDMNKDFISPSSTILRPAYCKTASGNLIRKTGYFTEVTNVGICLYEAYWTLINLHNIQSKPRMQRDGTSYYSMDGRKKLILEDFLKETEEVREIMILGDTAAFIAKCRSESIQWFIWEDDTSPAYLDDSKPTLLIYDKHCICAKTLNLKEEWAKKTKTREDAEKKLFEFRPLPPPKELPEEINYYLDIETSIDPETKVFTPYLICVVGSTPEDTHRWWGKDSCKLEFLEWLETLVDKDYNTSVKHRANKPKISIWTYNGMKFDLVFLVRSMINLPHFDIKGSVDNIKSLQICNITFRDLLKIVPIGSLRKQSQFWKTEHEKGQEDFEETTDEFIDLIDKAERGLIANQEEAFYYSRRRTEIIDYCELDCVVLKECVEAYIKWVWTNLGVNPYVISTAGLALRYYQTHHHPAINKENPNKPMARKFFKGIPKEYYDVLKASYKGGIVMNLKKVNDNKILYVDTEEYVSDIKLSLYDINSSYPFTMLRRIPVELLNVINYRHGGPHVCDVTLTIQDYNLYQIFGLEWKPDTKIPTIPRKTKDGLNNTIKLNPVEYIWGCELKLARNTGNLLHGSITKVFEFRAEKIFESYVDELYMKRRRKCKETGDAVGDKLYKLLLNSLYGKFGQKLYPYTKVVDESSLLYYADKIICPPRPYGGGIYQITLDEYASEAHFQADEEQIDVAQCVPSNIGFLIHIASFISAGGRCNLMKGATAVGYEDLWYTDTDSMFIRWKPEGIPYALKSNDQQMEEEDVDAMLRFLIIDDADAKRMLRKIELKYANELGTWKNELKKYGADEDGKDDVEWKIFEAGFAQKKNYYYREINELGEKKTVFKSKGLEVGSLTIKNYHDLINGEQVSVVGGNKWTSSGGAIRIQKNAKILGKREDPREFYNDGCDSRARFI